MSTRCRIAVRRPDGTFKSTYCHSEGFPEGVGAMLVKHYRDPVKLAALLALGDLSMLAEELGEQHPFDDRSRPTWCRAYGRDRGEKDTEAVISADLDALFALTQETGGEWLYVWNGLGWTCGKGGDSMFGMPADNAPDALESLDYWLQREAKLARA